MNVVRQAVVQHRTISYSRHDATCETPSCHGLAEHSSLGCTSYCRKVVVESARTTERISDLGGSELTSERALAFAVILIGGQMIARDTMRTALIAATRSAAHRSSTAVPERLSSQSRPSVVIRIYGHWPLAGAHSEQLPSAANSQHMPDCPQTGAGGGAGLNTGCGGSGGAPGKLVGPGQQL